MYCCCYPPCSKHMSTQIVTISEKRVSLTNQNMIITDAKSGLTMSMAIAVAISDPTLFQPAMPDKCFPSNRLVKRLETNANGGSRFKSLLDSMRASSPSRSRPNDADDHHKSWIVRHPSALSMFDDIVRAARGKQIVVFLDYDGTLSPIVDDPDCAFITTEMREAVRDVAKFFPTAIVSGRCRAKVYSFVRLSELYYAGSHGMDIKGPAKGHNGCRKGNQSVLCQPAREFLPMIDEIYKALMERVKFITGAKVENNKFCLSVHYRCVEETKWGELAEQVKIVIKDYPQLRLSQGRKVLEIRPIIKWDKGKALEFLLESLGYAESEDVLPIYIGDDRTDEDAFKVLHERGHGLGILVSNVPKETNASYSLQEPSEVMAFLKRLVEWKKLSVGRG